MAQHGKLKVGDALTINPVAPFGGDYQAKVRVVDMVIDSARGTIGVRLELPNPTGKLP